MRPFDRQRILLGVTGGIASYKAAWLARLLTQAGAEVDVVLTRAASEFIGAITFEALTGRPVHTALIASGHALDHITLARAAQLVVVAPATADFLARAVGGHADDLLSACLLATTAPTLLVPAMNDRMWAHPQVTRNAAAARELGYHVLDPDNGALAAGEGSGPGRMPEPETILAYCARLLETPTVLEGRSVVVTAGPTREPIDPVRFLSNRSSGKMGVAIAAAAWRRGADVTLIVGPLDVATPPGLRVVTVETTSQMREAVMRALPGAAALVMAAAPADFTAAAPASAKIKKADAGDALALVRTDDILAATRASRPASCVTVGFALETGDATSEAHRKVADKGLDFIVANDALEAGAGFGVDTNRVTIVHADGREEHLPLQSKTQVADQILDRIEGLLHGR
ncbi:bifunctional phosphopantothenoylcysteine decarboxylase/phosphopantothenate--cysteine ligase CoaBC [Gemmatimonas sp.]|uniref:bifunctional phosphopantothenoylcysteine decarboxylase/phosphopantothenate--cysteine ligase CoaBC n=1 Tax=Gemmatimonas sp. TaxID=1962908 RepID=UPI00286C90C1|nr:bifunctional phosphopantothenoylcysteine decarboxylase/phosphopantothenate--cysteine ligase CoaBC [Gemmatimonas sp.]